MLRYFKEECLEEERAVVEMYLALGIDEEYVNDCFVEAAKEMSQDGDRIADGEVSTQWNIFINNVDFSGEEHPVSEKIVKLKSRKVTYVACGLIAALLVVVSCFGIYHYSAFSSPDFTIVSSETSPSKKIVLPDSTVICMSAQTILRYDSDFGIKHRYIELIEGEAYFDVQHNKELAFVVKAKNMSTQVLGTAFLITSYNKLSYTDIQVTRGRVNVTIGTTKYSDLTKGNGIHYNESEDNSTHYTFARSKFDPTSDELFLQGVTFQELAMRIENVFGYKLVAGTPAIAGQHYTTQISPRDGIEDLLSNISWIHHGEYKIVGKEVIMY